MSDKVQLEYIGITGAVWNDGEKDISLVAGRRYPVDAALADYMVAHDVNHWKRPESVKPVTAAKEK
jgi:hypothetical protein